LRNGRIQGCLHDRCIFYVRRELPAACLMG
jgi:hypothetical protein